MIESEAEKLIQLFKELYLATDKVVMVQKVDNIMAFLEEVHISKLYFKLQPLARQEYRKDFQRYIDNPNLLTRDSLEVMRIVLSN